MVDWGDDDRALVTFFFFADLLFLTGSGDDARDDDDRSLTTFSFLATLLSFADSEGAAIWLATS